MKNILNKINFRLILVHFIACWFFIHAFQTFSYLMDVEILKASHKGDKELMDLLKFNGETDVVRMSDYLICNILAPLAGLLSAFVISISVSIRRKWFWLNSVIALIFTYLLIYFDFSGWKFIKKILFFQVRITSEIVFSYILGGSLLLLLGLFLFFSKKAIQFIAKGQNKSVIRG